MQNESPLAWRLHEKTRKIQEGVVEDPKFYGRIYCADREDDPGDSQTWVKANPSLIDNRGFVELERIRQQYVSHAAEGDLTSFKRYYLNLWDQKEHRVIDLGKYPLSFIQTDAFGRAPGPAKAERQSRVQSHAPFATIGGL